MDKGIYTAGTLLWLDDNFLDDAYFGEGTDLHFWRQTLGETDHRVNRLLNLAIEPVTSLSEFEDALADYVQSAEQYHRFLFGVIDLHVPEKTPPRGLQVPADDPAYKSKMKNGLLAAEQLASNGIPFIFLSSSSQGQKSLASAGLQTRPYFQKVHRGRGAIMPPDATRFILQEFRSHIGWLDIGPLVERLGLLRDKRERAERFAISYFPFFSANRDFVERWELRSEYAASCNRIVFRTPRSHSREFICQCVALTLDRNATAATQRLEYIDSRKDTQDRVDDLAARPDGVVIVARFHGDLPVHGRNGAVSDAPDESRLLAEIIKKFPRNKVFFILPPDELADQRLSELSIIPGVFYDDLPATRLQDQTAREELLRRASRFVLHNQVGRALKVRAGAGEAVHIDALYLNHAELLIDPVNWAFLMEADQVADQISDSVEVLRELFKSAQSIGDWHDDKSTEHLPDRLATGKPLPAEHLFKTADHILRDPQQSSLLPIWTVRAFSTWLVRSWNTPYGFVTEGHPHEELWTEHCLVVARRLAREAMVYFGNSMPILIDRFGKETISDLTKAASFLLDPAIDQLLDGKPGINWEGFEARRWPHSAFPVSTYLNRRLLRDGGRYFFPHANELDSATLLFDGRHALRRLELRARFYRQRMEWAGRVASQLPMGWSQPLSFLVGHIENRTIDVAWQANDDSVWDALMCLQRNALRVAFTFYAVTGADGYRKDADIKSALKDLYKTKGAGSLLGKLRGNRGETYPAHVTLRPCAFWNEELAIVDDALENIRFLTATEMAHQAASGAGEVPLLRKLMRNVHDGLKGAGADGSSLSRPLMAMFSPAFEMAKELPATADLSDFERLGRFDTLTAAALNSDVLMALTAAGAGLNQALRPIIYSDGYHFLSMLYERRNDNKATQKTVTDEIGAPANDDPRAKVQALNAEMRNQLLEFFIYGLEGLVQQLKWVLIASGESELADTIEDDLFMLAKRPEARPDILRDFVRISRFGDGQYGVYTPGNEGNKVVKRFGFTDYVDGVMSMRLLSEGARAE